MAETGAPTAAVTSAPRSLDAARAATLAALEAGEASAKPAVAAKPDDKKPEPAKIDLAKADAKADAKPDVDADADDDVDDAAALAAADPDMAKRLQVVQRQEKRSRESLTKEREAAAAEITERVRAIETEWAPRVKAAEDFEALKKRARFEPEAVLEALGVAEDDFEAVAQSLYARAKAKSGDPKYKEAALRVQQQREQAARMEKLEREAAADREALKQRDQRQTVEGQVAAYVDHAVKAIGDKTPLTSQYLATNPAKARAAIWKFAAERHAETGELPTPDKAIAAYEAHRLAELAEFGVDPATVIKAKPAAESKTETKADAKPDVKAAAKPVVVPETETKPKTLKEQRAETLRKLEAGELD